MRRAAVAGLLFFIAATGVNAQASTCVNRDRAGSRLQQSNSGLPNEVTVITRPDLLCDGGRRILADLATVSKAAGRIELVGNVDVEDPDQRLRGDRATFFSGTKRLESNGNVILTSRDGSRITGDILVYDQKTDQRPARIETTGTTRFARAVMVDTTGAAPDTTIVDASQIIIVGQQSFTAINNVSLFRDSLIARGAQIHYAQADSLMQITGNGRVELPRQVMTGDSITATLGADDEINSVLTRHGASLRGEDMSVVAPAIRLFMEAGEVNRMVAMDWTPARGNSAPVARPRVDGQQFRMDADSIDVVAPGGELESAVAIGSAYSERVTPDSLAKLIPPAEGATSSLIANDWMRGDTLRATFAPNPAAAQDTTAAAQVLERILAVGAPAQSMYRIRNEEQPDALLTISYLNANRIEVSFEKGVAQVVLAEGNVKGVYVQPGQGRESAGSTPGGVGR